MINEDKAVEMIATAINTLANNENADLWPVFSNAAYTTVNICHSLGAISDQEYLHSCDRIRRIDARYLGLEGSA